jgi:hypothetical protein
MPAAGPERRIVGADANPGHHLHARDKRHQQIAARRIVAFGDGERGWHHLGRDVGHGRGVGVAHGDGGDEKAVEQGCAGERQPITADHAGLVRLRERRGQRRDLPGFLAALACNRAGERIEQQVLALLAHA